MDLVECFRGGQMMFEEVQVAFWVGYKLKLSNKFIISKQNHKPVVKTFHHLLYGWQNNGFRLQSCWEGVWVHIWVANKFHAYKM